MTPVQDCSIRVPLNLFFFLPGNLLACDKDIFNVPIMDFQWISGGFQFCDIIDASDLWGVQWKMPVESYSYFIWS